jgi:hypothetical protein
MAMMSLASRVASSLCVCCQFTPLVDDPTGWKLGYRWASYEKNTNMISTDDSLQQDIANVLQVETGSAAADGGSAQGADGTHLMPIGERCFYCKTTQLLFYPNESFEDSLSHEVPCVGCQGSLDESVFRCAWTAGGWEQVCIYDFDALLLMLNYHP